MTGDGRALDEALLRVAAERLGSLSTVDSVAVFPREKPESVVARFDLRYYPEAVRAVELELRAFTSGDVHVTYREEWPGTDWQCRWDRHENPHSARDHFHRLPDAEEAVDRDFPADFFELLGVLISHIGNRLEVSEDQESVKEIF